jgi:hypothetical protein
VDPGGSSHRRSRGIHHPGGGKPDSAAQGDEQAHHRQGEQQDSHPQQIALAYAHRGDGRRQPGDEEEPAASGQSGQGPPHGLPRPPAIGLWLGHSGDDVRDDLRRVASPDLSFGGGQQPV